MKRSRKSVQGYHNRSREDRQRARQARKEAARYAKARDGALLSMDRAKILKWLVEYRVGWPKAVINSEAVFWVMVHKTRAAVRSIPLDERRKSAAWLRGHGFNEFDGSGEL